MAGMLIANLVRRKGVVPEHLLNETINQRETDMKKRTNSFFAALAVCVAGYFVIVSAQEYNGWSFKSNNQGQVVAMTISNPVTYLGIESGVAVEIGADGTPQGGSVKFKDGVERDMSKFEASTYWDVLQGPHALWSYWEAQGKLMTIKTNAAIPPEWIGAMTRMKALSGKEVIGTLVNVNSQQQYSIHVEGEAGGDIPFTMNAVGELQQLKR
ncbi:MAG: hypothetical protein ABSF80_00985 [Chitinispirillaceae bacterium]|jgi:hypothetical protein